MKYKTMRDGKLISNNIKKIRMFDSRENKIMEVDRARKTNADRNRILIIEQYHVTHEKGTELPFTCLFDTIKASGVYQCVRCRTDLFRTDVKLDPGMVWPRYYEAVSHLNIRLESGYSLGMQRTEMLCARCNVHLGHLFDEVPPPT